MKTDLSNYTALPYRPGASVALRAIWFVSNAVIMQAAWMPLSGLRVMLLRWFGARIGKGVVIKPSVNIKYPWRLRIGDYSWIGEKVWIDNLENVEIGAHVCISQGAVLLCGNHNYKKAGFDLIAKPITLEDGVWIGAGAMVTGGVHCASHSVLAVMSVASSNLKAYTIYRGNPAVEVAQREIDA
jgi:putative colanic acid biosynthesis acetyltransferase WcaF